MRTSDEPCLLLAEAIEERWPLAYAAVRDGRLVVSGLLDHSRDVASILTGVEILRRRLLVLGERARDFYGWRDEDVLGLARAAALLHDLGKASQRYRQRALEGLKRCRGPQHSISFPHHELVPAALLLAYASNVDERLRRAIDIVAEAVARHHAAMIGRGQQSRGHRIPTNELVEIARGIPRGFVEELKDECEGHGLCLDILEATGKALEEGGDLVSVADGLANGKSVLNVEENPRRIMAIQTLAGLLVVADNLAAACERGGAADYAEIWARELGALDALRAAEEGRAEECVRRIVGAGVAARG